MLNSVEKSKILDQSLILATVLLKIISKFLIPANLLTLEF